MQNDRPIENPRLQAALQAVLELAREEDLACAVMLLSEDEAAFGFQLFTSYNAVIEDKTLPLGFRFRLKSAELGQERAEAMALATGSFEASPRAVRSDVPDELDAICRKALALDPADRYQTALQMQCALEEFLDGQVGPRAATQALAELVGQLFSDQRADVARRIEQHMDRLCQPNAPELSPLNLDDLSTNGSSPPRSAAWPPCQKSSPPFPPGRPPGRSTRYEAHHRGPSRAAVFGRAGSAVNAGSCQKNGQGRAPMIRSDATLGRYRAWSGDVGTPKRRSWGAS